MVSIDQNYMTLKHNPKIDKRAGPNSLISDDKNENIQWIVIGRLK